MLVIKVSFYLWLGLGLLGLLGQYLETLLKDQ